MRLGVDSYSYHRLLGELRPGEEPAAARFARGALDVIAEVRRLGVEVVSLETCFLEPPSALNAAALREAAGGLEIALAWGHPHGLEYGANPAALAELLAWIELAPAAGCEFVRLVAASPRFRNAEPVSGQIARTVPALRAAAERAGAAGVRLALENHGDLTAAEIVELLERTDADVGVCLDTANLLRVGDDPLAATRLLAPRVRIVHLKDVRALSTVTNPVAGPASVAYGEGVIPVAAILDALDEDGYDGPVCVELGQIDPGTDECALVEHCVAWLSERAKADARDQGSSTSAGAEERAPG